MNQSATDHPAFARGRVSLEHQVFEVSVYRSSGYESSSLTLLHETRFNQNGANFEEERMIEEEPPKQWEDAIEPEAEGKGQEICQEQIDRIEAIPEIYESPCQRESVPKHNSEDEESEGIREDNEAKLNEHEEEVQGNKKKRGKRKIIRKEVREPTLRREPTFFHVETRRNNVKLKLRKREGSVCYYRERDSILKLYEKGVSPKYIQKAFGINQSTLNNWKNQTHLKEKGRLRMNHENGSRMELEKKDSQKLENIFFDKMSKLEKKRQKAQDLFRQGFALKQIASKLQSDYNTTKNWTRQLLQEVKNKYAEGLESIETALRSNFKEGNYLLFNDIEKVFQETFAGDTILLGNKDWIFFTVKKLKLHQRYILIKSKNRRIVENEEILENSRRLLKKYPFLRNAEEDYKEIVELHKQGKTLTYICREVTKCEGIVRKLIKSIDEENMNIAEDKQTHWKAEGRFRMKHEDKFMKGLANKKNKNYENFGASQSLKNEEIVQKVVNLYRQGMVLKDIASKMSLDSKVVNNWTRPFMQEVKNKYAEGLKKIETDLLCKYKEGRYLLFNDIEKIFKETFAGDIFLLGNKDLIFLTIKKLKLYQRYKLVKSRNRTKLEKEEIMEKSRRLLCQHAFLKNSLQHKKEITELHRQGKTLNQISSQVGLSKHAVRKWIKKIEEQNAFYERKEHESQIVYQEIVKNKRKGSSITEREIREFASRHIADLTLVTVHGWVERFIEYFRLSERYEIH